MTRGGGLKRSGAGFMGLMLVVGIGAVGCARLSVSQRASQHPGIGNFQQVAPGIYRGAQPDEAGLRALKAMGITTIVSLRVPPRVIDWEREPSQEAVARFLSIVTDPTRQPVFVHCREGQLRTGAMMASYRVLKEGWTAQDAYAEAKALGFDDRYPWYLPLKWFITDLEDHEKARALASEPVTS